MQRLGLKQLSEFEGYLDGFSKLQETSMKDLQDRCDVLRQQQISYHDGSFASLDFQLGAALPHGRL